MNLERQPLYLVHKYYDINKKKSRCQRGLVEEGILIIFFLKRYTDIL